MGIYCQLYPGIVDQILQSTEHGSVHGSQVRQWFITLAQGRFAVDNHAEALLTELVEEGVLQYDPNPNPTPSQAAFYGLGGGQSKDGWIPGRKEHFRYSRVRSSVTSSG